MIARRDLLNLASLTLIQVSNAVLPLLIFPFVLGVVGAEYYSKIVLSEALALVSLSFIIYSFDIEGVARVVGLSLERDLQHISEAFCEILYLRLTIFAICATLVFLLSLLLDRDLRVLLLFWMLVPLSYALQSNWLFQGLERNFALAIFVVTSRMLSVISVYIFVRGPEDYWLVPIAVGVFAVVAGLASIIYAVLQLGLRFCRIPARTFALLLMRGKEIFLGNLSVTLYRDVNVIILGIFGVQANLVSAYSISEKIVKSLQASVRPLNQFFFPKVLRAVRYHQGPSPYVLKRISIFVYPQLLTVLCMLAVIFLAYRALGDPLGLIRDASGLDLIESYVAIMIVAVFFGIANFMFGIAGLNSLNERKYLFKAIVITGVLSVTICACAVIAVGATGAPISFVFAEVLLFALIIRKYRIRERKIAPKTADATNDRGRK